MMDNFGRERGTVLRILEFRGEREYDNGAGNLAKQWLFTCIIILGKFLCRLLQNINVKYKPISALSGKCEQQRLIFCISQYLKAV